MKKMNPFTSITRTGILLAALLVIGCQPSQLDETIPSSTAVPGSETALKNVFQEAFLVGAALNPEQFFERDTRGATLIKTHFNTITPENVLKWERVHPEPGRYDFEPSDRFVQFGEDNDMFMVGHTLVWHSQTPEWVFQDAQGNPVSRDSLLARMRDHILTVVGRYRGRVDGWDVVNEALNDDGTLRETPWLKIIGEEYIARAFEYAREADPDAELYYNDYSLPNPAKRDGAVALVKKLQEQGVPVTGIGMQGHYKMDWPSPGLVDTAITAFAPLGDVMITEFDIDVLPPAMAHQGADVSQNVALRDSLNPYTDGLPADVQDALAKRYADLFIVFLKHRDALTRVTFWGVTDADSWLNNWPVRGRTAYPLLFDRSGQPKPAFEAVVQTAQQSVQ